MFKENMWVVNFIRKNVRIVEIVNVYKNIVCER